VSGHKFPYRWRISDGYPAAGIQPHGCRVFGTFICGGGGTMGYKLAGFEHLGGVEIDPKIAEIYRQNHHPKHLFIQDLRKFNAREDLPSELYELDVLDGSPPCSTFSMAGSREKAWGKEKVFREGQTKQTLDDLVFVYCDTIAKLKPRVCLLENVSGLVKGNARSYCRRIVQRLMDAGYRVQVFLLNAAIMGVPQTRQRTYFLGVRKEFDWLPKLVIDVNEPLVKFGEVIDRSVQAQDLSDLAFKYWQRRKAGDTSFADVVKRDTGRTAWFNSKFAKSDAVCPTITAVATQIVFDYPRHLTPGERFLVSSFPTDYQATAKDVPFLTGMGVAPVQMAHIADAIYNQWLKPINERKN
jgi:DNA (cytosine-5)-methyltransferase 1